MIKDWFLDQGYTSISIEGRLYVVLQGMADRAKGTSSYNSVGFDPRWGGGRFQMRYFSGSEPGYPWGWESYSAVLSDGQISDHSLFGNGLEPSTLHQYKAYATFFEEDSSNIADIDLLIMDDNCSGNTLDYDISRDIHSMVRLGTSAAGKALCNRLHAYHVPSGQTRRVHVFAYYSGDTNMR